MTTVQNFIGGELVDSDSAATMPLVDPSTGEQYGTAPVSDEADVDRHVRGWDHASDHAPTWVTLLDD